MAQWLWLTLANVSVVAGRFDDLKSFVTVHRVKREHAPTQPHRGDQSLRRRDFVQLLVDDTRMRKSSRVL
jgi:hypothetical protein